MAKTLIFRRRTTGELSTVIGAEGELFVDTTKDTVVVMDGSTPGGKALATEAALTTMANDTEAALTTMANDTEAALNTKQNSLVSGTNIKTLNGETILGAGDLEISGGISPDPGIITRTTVTVPVTGPTYVLSTSTFSSAYLIAPDPSSPMTPGNTQNILRLFYVDVEVSQALTALKVGDTIDTVDTNDIHRVVTVSGEATFEMISNGYYVNIDPFGGTAGSSIDIKAFTITKTVIVDKATFDFSTGNYFNHSVPEGIDQIFEFSETLTNTQASQWALNIANPPATTTYDVSNVSLLVDGVLAPALGVDSANNVYVPLYINSTGTQILRFSGDYPLPNFNSGSLDFASWLDAQIYSSPFDFNEVPIRSGFVGPSVGITLPSGATGVQYPPTYWNTRMSADGKAVYIELSFDMQDGSQKNGTVVIILNTPNDFTSGAASGEIWINTGDQDDFKAYKSVISSGGTYMTYISGYPPYGIPYTLKRVPLATPYLLSTMDVANIVSVSLPNQVTDFMAVGYGGTGAMQLVASNKVLFDVGYTSMNTGEPMYGFFVYSIPDTGRIIELSDPPISFGTISASNRRIGKYHWNSSGTEFYVLNTYMGAKIVKFSSSSITYGQITWPAALTWANETAPTITATPKIVEISTFDGGQTYTGNYTIPDTISVSSINVITYTSSGTYTPSANTLFFEVIAVGGGGGGGGTDGGSNGATSASGGAGGCTVIALVKNVLPSYVVAIGNKGDGGNTSFSYPYSGGDTTVSESNNTQTIHAIGGISGTNAASGEVTYGRLPTSEGSVNGAGVEMINLIPGEYGYNNLAGNRLSPNNDAVMSGRGGSSHFGTGGAAVGYRAGVDGIGYGAGGSGASGYGYPSLLGGNGVQGVVYIKEYLK